MRLPFHAGQRVQMRNQAVCKGQKQRADEHPQRRHPYAMPASQLHRRQNQAHNRGRQHDACRKAQERIVVPVRNPLKTEPERRAQNRRAPYAQRGNQRQLHINASFILSPAFLPQTAREKPPCPAPVPAMEQLYQTRAPLSSAFPRALPCLFAAWLELFAFACV